jgi:two-component system, NarL family, response regulator NreC
VIGLSMFADRRYVTAMLASGAAGYLLKDCAAGDLARAIYAVDGDLTFLSPAVTRLVVEEMMTREAVERASLDVLTTREREVLELSARGESIKSIAMELDINPKTIYAFRASMMKKLGIASQADLIKFALKEGMAGDRRLG